ncbi:MAG: hypothetical protein K0Q55_3777 [Verrucomicrobia bacterium]|jgi:uncharacterized membrane protein|nr:hypothetical protein [Verrucomicrobiota bacterium]
MPPNIKPPTPAELVAIIFLFAGAMIAFGAVGLWKAAQLPPERAEVIAELQHYGGWSMGIGIGVLALFFLIRRFWPY